MTLYDYCIAFDRTDLLDQWNKDRNVDISVDDVTHGSHKQAWWICEKVMNGKLRFIVGQEAREQGVLTAQGRE